jgi:bile acid:Na+ symporter, BASS family
MPVSGAIPEAVLTVVAAATVFTVMFSIGLGIVPREFRWVWGNPGLVARGLFSVLVAVPAVALVVARAFDLPRLSEIGIVLMAISPGAPVALRRSLSVGGHRSFAPALQILVAVLAVVSMPLSIAAFDEVYAGHASISPAQLARQVFTAQLLPLGFGMLVRRAAPMLADRLQPRLARLGNLLLIVLAILALINVWHVVVDSGPRIAFAIAVVTALALAVGHMLGGPDPGTRTAVAISSAARNPGLALLVATLNNAAPEIGRTVLAYLLVSALTVSIYVIWRRRAALRAGSAR